MFVDREDDRSSETAEQGQQDGYQVNLVVFYPIGRKILITAKTPSSTVFTREMTVALLMPRCS